MFLFLFRMFVLALQLKYFSVLGVLSSPTTKPYKKALISAAIYSSLGSKHNLKIYLCRSNTLVIDYCSFWVLTKVVSSSTSPQ